MPAAIFDLDGLLIDSEPLWRRAEIEVLGACGVPLDDEMCRQTMGLRIDEVVTYWHRRFPWREPPPAQVEADIVERVRQLIGEEAEPLEGVHRTIRDLRAAGWRLGLASSSPPVLIEAAVERLGLSGVFATLCSATHEARGKPDPAVYLTAARRLDEEPQHCVAFEDSAAGLRSALGAGLRVVAVPAPESYDDPSFDAAHWKLSSLDEFEVDLITPADSGSE